MAAVVVVTGDDGRASFVFDPPLARVPVLAATPVNQDPGMAETVTVALEVVTAGQVTVRVWRTQPLLRLGLMPSVPVGAGVPVHLVAMLPPA